MNSFFDYRQQHRLDEVAHIDPVHLADRAQLRVPLGAQLGAYVLAFEAHRSSRFLIGWYFGRAIGADQPGLEEQPLVFEPDTWWYATPLPVAYALHAARVGVAQPGGYQGRAAERVDYVRVIHGLD